MPDSVNVTLLNEEDLCTLATCPIDFAYVEYIPTLAGNALYLALFAVFLAGQVGLGIRYRTWGFMAGMSIGILLEIIGYAGRLMLHNNPFSYDGFLMYLVPLTIGPAFLAAAIYICLARIVTVYGENFSRLRPRNYTILFVSCDVISLIMQAAGGGIASASDSESDNQTGVNIMIAGLSFQVFSIALFMALSLDFAWKVRSGRRRGEAIIVDARKQALTQSGLFKAFLLALALATVTIFVRSIFRVAELSEGFGGPIANDQVAFMIAEGAMIIIACFSLTALHPGVCFKGEWGAANFHMRSKNDKRAYEGSSDQIDEAKVGAQR